MFWEKELHNWPSRPTGQWELYSLSSSTVGIGEKSGYPAEKGEREMNEASEDAVLARKSLIAPDREELI